MFWTKELVQKVEETMRIRADRPFEEKRQEMIDKGWIDQNGNYLFKMPEWGGQMYPGQPRPPEVGDPSDLA